jgi:predicted choloylglycine hydrolase
MTQQTKQAVYQHLVLEGSAYEVGRRQGELIKQVPPVKEWFGSGAKTLSDAELKEIYRQIDRFCPGLREEIQGCADSLGIVPEQVVYFFESYIRVNHCSHFAVLPGMTANGHLLVGRSYEFSDTMDDLSFFTTRISGKYAHIGSPGLWLGRNDGMNEHGLSVTMSAGGIPVGRREGMTPPIQTGFMFWVLVRALLEQCRTVDEALTFIEDFPCTGIPILMLADREGRAALVEIWGPKYAVKQIDAASTEQSLWATNHFALPEMIPNAPYMMKHSSVRYDAIAERLQHAAPHVTAETARELLSTPYPSGLCTHYYEEFFGTLHSIVFDVTAGMAEVCFGSPQTNAWHRFDLGQAAEAGSYTVRLPIEHPTPEFWERIPLH